VVADKGLAKSGAEKPETEGEYSNGNRLYTLTYNIASGGMQENSEDFFLASAERIPKTGRGKPTISIAARVRAMRRRQ
jgi:hypothetical protein